MACLADTDGDCADATDVQRPGRLAAFTAAGTLLPWAPRLTDDANDIAFADDAIYAVGHFSCIGGIDDICGNDSEEQVRLHAAAFDAVTGTLLPWNPGASVGLGSPASSAVDTVVPDLERGHVLLAGNFTCLQTAMPADADCSDAGEVARRGVASVDPATGAAQAWGPGSITGLPASPGEQVPARNLALTADRQNVLFSGAPATLEGQGRELLGSLAADSGAAAGWNPGGVGPVFGLATAPGVAIAHGSFEVAGGSVREGLALFGSYIDTSVAVPISGRDTTRPVISKLSIGRRFRLGKGLVKAAAKKPKVPVGTTVRFTLSEAATVRLTVGRKLAGRRSGKRCVAPTKKRRKAKRCTRTVAVKGSASVAGRAGANRVAFAGRLSKKIVLKPGEYLLSAVATDVAGNRSVARTAKFTLVKTPKAKKRS